MNDFQSSQKLKYDQVSNKPQSVNHSFVNAPITMVSKELFTL
jgi:spindle assembly abnormal protein 6